MPLDLEQNKFAGDRFYPVTFDGVSPAAGVAFSLAVPSNLVYHVVAIRFLFTTANVAANRWPYVGITTGGALFCNLVPSLILQPLNSVYTHDFQVGVTGVDMSVVQNVTISPLSSQMFLTDRDELVIDCYNFNAADTISNIRIRVHRWTEN